MSVDIKFEKILCKQNAVLLFRVAIFNFFNKRHPSTSSHVCDVQTVNSHSMHTQDICNSGRESEIPSNHYGNQNVSNSTKLSEIFRQSHEKYRKI